MRFEISPQILVDYQVKACGRLPAEYIAYLFTTGKNELFLRDLLAAELQNNFGLQDHEYIAREWVMKGVTKHPHDLAFIDGQHIKFLVEGKSWIHNDALDVVKLNNPKSYVLDGINPDIQKIRETLKDFGDVKGFLSTILYSIDVGDEERHNYPNNPITYAQKHKSGVKACGSFDKLVETGRKNYLELISSFGTVASATILDSACDGMRVVADFFVVEILL